MRRTLPIALAVAFALAGCYSRQDASRTPNTTNPATPPATSTAPTCTPAATPAPPASTAQSPSSSDASTAAAATDPATFVDKAGRAGAFEVEASKLAQTAGTSPDVKNFANRMVDDHTHAAAELKQAAGTLTVPGEPSADQRAKLDALKGRTGADFDRQYASEVGVAAHEEAVALFDDYAKNGTDAGLKAFATKTLPTLREHLDMARKMAASVVASK